MKNLLVIGVAVLFLGLVLNSSVVYGEAINAREIESTEVLEESVTTMPCAQEEKTVEDLAIGDVFLTNAVFSSAFLLMDYGFLLLLTLVGAPLGGFLAVIGFLPAAIYYVITTNLGFSLSFSNFPAEMPKIGPVPLGKIPLCFLLVSGLLSIAGELLVFTIVGAPLGVLLLLSSVILSSLLLFLTFVETFIFVHPLAQMREWVTTMTYALRRMWLAFKKGFREG